MYSIERWVQDWYGLNLHTDRGEWLCISPTAVIAAAHAAGFISALDLTNGGLAAQLATNRRNSIDGSVRLLAATRDMAWQSVTALAAEAHRRGCTSLPTGPNSLWKPVCVRDQEVAGNVYPALRCGEEPDTPPRFTVRTAERISGDLSHQHGQRIRVSLTGDVLTVSFGEHPITRDTRHEPDQDGLYALGAARLNWQVVHGE